MARSGLDVVDLYSGAVTYVEVGTKLLEAFGLIGGDRNEFEALGQQIDAVAGELSWHMWALAATDVQGLIDSAFVAAQDVNLAAGGRLPRGPGHDATSAGQLSIAGTFLGGEPTYFLRRYSESATSGPWRNVIENDAPRKYGENGAFVFDWRFPLPWYLHLVAKRLSVMAAGMSRRVLIFEAAVSSA